MGSSGWSLQGSGGGGTITGGGTVPYLPLWTAATALGDSIVSQGSSTQITINEGDLVFKANVANQRSIYWNNLSDVTVSGLQADGTSGLNLFAVGHLDINSSADGINLGANTYIVLEAVTTIESVSTKFNLGSDGRVAFNKSLTASTMVSSKGTGTTSSTFGYKHFQSDGTTLAVSIDDTGGAYFKTAIGIGGAIGGTYNAPLTVYSSGSANTSVSIQNSGSSSIGLQIDANASSSTCISTFSQSNAMNSQFSSLAAGINDSFVIFPTSALATGTGVAYLYKMKGASGVTKNMARTGVIWSNATGGSEQSAHVWQTMTGGSAIAEAMRLDGKSLGIGTSSPSATLHSVGVGTTSSNSNFYTQNSANTSFFNCFNNGNYTFQSQAGSLVTIKSDDTGYSQFYIRPHNSVNGATGTVLKDGDIQLRYKVNSYSAFVFEHNDGSTFVPFGINTISDAVALRVKAKNTANNEFAIQLLNGSDTVLLSQRNDGVLFLTAQVGNSGLTAGMVYKDTAANILANSDYVLAMKA